MGNKKLVTTRACISKPRPQSRPITKRVTTEQPRPNIDLGLTLIQLKKVAQNVQHHKCCETWKVEALCQDEINSTLAIIEDTIGVQNQKKVVTTIM